MGNNVLVKCRACGGKVNRIEDKEIFATWKKVNSRQGNYFFLCSDCMTPVYHRTPQPCIKRVVGTPKKTGNRTGFELEITDIESSLFLYENNLVLTSDSSVNGDEAEWVSPIYEGLTPIPKVLETIYADCAKYIDLSCGTHVHISNHDETMWSYIEQLFGFGYGHEKLMSITGLLERHLLDNEAETIRIWGREIGSYRKAYSKDYKSTLHYDSKRYFWININNLSQSKKTLEFRLPLFVNKDQFMELIKFFHEFYRIIYENRLYNDNAIAEALLAGYKEHFHI